MEEKGVPLYAIGLYPTQRHDIFQEIEGADSMEEAKLKLRKLIKEGHRPQELKVKRNIDVDILLDDLTITIHDE